VLAAVALLALSGCSLFREESAPRPEVTAPEAAPTGTAATPARKSADRAKGTKSSARDGAASRPAAPPETLAVAAPEPPAQVAAPPQVTVQLSAQQRSVREMAYRDDSGRAARALEAVRKRVLNSAQRDQLGSADRFLADAVVAFEGNDLVRACSLAQKARVLAEELKAAVAP
jgi:hypothetical protein